MSRASVMAHCAKRGWPEAGTISDANNFCDWDQMTVPPNRKSRKDGRLVYKAFLWSSVKALGSPSLTVVCRNTTSILTDANRCALDQLY